MEQFADIPSLSSAMCAALAAHTTRLSANRFPHHRACVGFMCDSFARFPSSSSDFPMCWFSLGDPPHSLGALCCYLWEVDPPNLPSRRRAAARPSLSGRSRRDGINCEVGTCAEGASMCRSTILTSWSRLHSCTAFLICAASVHSSFAFLWLGACCYGAGHTR